MENKWMTVKVKYTKQQEDGCFKRVTESFLIQAYSFTDAEAVIYKEMDYVKGEFEVCSIVKTELIGILKSQENSPWWDAKAKTAKDENDKSLTHNLLVQADSVAEAYKKIEEDFNDEVIGFTITAVKKSAIVDIFEGH